MINKHIYLTTTPNQRNFVSQLEVGSFEPVIQVCDGFSVDQYRELAKNLNPKEVTVYIPYYGSVDGIYCADVMRGMVPELRVEKFYESLISYFVHPWFCELYRNSHLDQKYFEEDTRDDFVGICELDDVFKRKSRPDALSFHKVYPEQAASEALQKSGGIFIGQPLEEDGSLDGEIYRRVVAKLFQEGLIDTYIKHPREKVSTFSYLNVVKLEAPLECYRGTLQHKRLYTVFSTGCAYFSIFHQNVTIADISPECFTISPWAHEVYSWLKRQNPRFLMGVTESQGVEKNLEFSFT